MQSDYFAVENDQHGDKTHSKVKCYAHTGVMYIHMNLCKIKPFYEIL